MWGWGTRHTSSSLLLSLQREDFTVSVSPSSGQRSSGEPETLSKPQCPHLADGANHASLVRLWRVRAPFSTGLGPGPSPCLGRLGWSWEQPGILRLQTGLRKLALGPSLDSHSFSRSGPPKTSQAPPAPRAPSREVSFTPNGHVSRVCMAKKLGAPCPLPGDPQSPRNSGE